MIFLSLLTAADGEGQASLADVLYFCTGLKTVPPMGLAQKISIEFLRYDESEVLPKADACFGIIRVPVVHSNRDNYFKKMDIGILYSSNHYGRM